MQAYQAAGKWRKFKKVMIISSDQIYNHTMMKNAGI